MNYDNDEVSNLTAEDIESIRMTSDGLGIDEGEGRKWWYTPFGVDVVTELSINGMRVTRGPCKGWQPSLTVSRVEGFSAHIEDPGPEEDNYVVVEIDGHGEFSSA